MYAADPPRVVHLDLRSFRPKYSIANNAAMVEATIAARTRISRREIPRSSCRIRGGRVDLAQNSEPKREALKMLHARPDRFDAASIITEFACYICRASRTWHATCVCSHLEDEARHESYVIMPNLHSQMRRYSLCRSHLAPKVRSLRLPRARSPTRSLIGFRPPFPIADQAPRLPRDENTSKNE